MTAHVPDLPLPAPAEFCDDQESLQLGEARKDRPSKMTFYAEYIRQCRILGEILSHVYQPSIGGTTTPSSSWFDNKSRGLDAILELDAKLAKYEAALPAIMSWKSPCDISRLEEDRGRIIVTQRTVLRER
jgi:hypothetical protein